MSELIKVNSVSKTYLTGQVLVSALSKVSLSCEPGDYIAIVGPSGAGKSTLLHILGGLDSPTKGQVIFEGQNIYKLSSNELSTFRGTNIGFVFQFYHLIEELNVFENVTLPLISRRKKYSLKAMQELLKYLGVEDRAKFFPSQLSGGQRQRVAFARALANDPKVLLCDEPTGNLDHESKDRIVLLLDKLNKEKNKTIILVTHNLELAKKAKKILFIKDGQLKDSS